jgi:hypothetical protein
MVGSRRLELPTSSVSRKRSNQLSYEPTNRLIDESNTWFESTPGQRGVRTGRNLANPIYVRCLQDPP